MMGGNRNVQKVITILFIAFANLANFFVKNGVVSQDANKSATHMESNESLTFEPLVVKTKDLPKDARLGSTLAIPKTMESSSEELLIKPRVFERKTVDQFPCFLEPPNATWWQLPQDDNQLPREGFFFLKTHKTGSSTGAGVHIRIARNMAARKAKEESITSSTATDMPICRVQFDHSTARQLKYVKRSKEQSFLWTIVREPNQRVLSQFFHFQVSRRNIPPSDRNFQAFLLTKNGPRAKPYYLRQLSMTVNGDNNHDNSTSSISRNKPATIDNSTTAMLTQVQTIINDYDFIAITERMDESVVALQMILGLSTADVLYLSAKSSGGYDAGGFKGKCIYIKPKNVTASMKTFLRESPLWEAKVKWDKMLYQAANKSLDLTIDALGREEFQKNLARFQQAQEVAQEQCLDTVRFPCSPSREGLAPLQKTDCLWKDSACGSECLDKVADQLKLWDKTQ